MKPASPQIVGVILSPADFQRATRMRNPPDLFELRLDALVASSGAIRNALEQLPAPAIITARHPREGGANELSPRERRALLVALLPYAAFVDIELRSVRALDEVLREAKANGIRIIISFHDFRGIPNTARLDEIAREARSLGADVVKIATRTDTPAQLESLLDFFERQGRTQRVVAMGIGKLGRISRLELARRGCALNYAHLGKAHIAGQLSISELRRALR
jgi:3-dehydroquinate dehydratase-1